MCLAAPEKVPCDPEDQMLLCHCHILIAGWSSRSSIICIASRNHRSTVSPVRSRRSSHELSVNRAAS
ncbi:hypothetical protein BOSEA1005_30698 [Hyphomicrobiales bacterium]|nr:hypothetical protein BOSEA1005_30698 [Hyphomicrobiales bacterium]